MLCETLEVLQMIIHSLFLICKFHFTNHKQTPLTFCRLSGDFPATEQRAEDLFYQWLKSKNISSGNFLPKKNSPEITGALTPCLPLRPGTPPVSSPSTMSFDLCGAVNAADQPHDRPCSHSHPVRWPTICQPGPGDLGRWRGPTTSPPSLSPTSPPPPPLSTLHSSPPPWAH